MTIDAHTRKVLSIHHSSQTGPARSPAELLRAEDVHYGSSSTHSPLWMLTTEPLLNELVIELQSLRLALERFPRLSWELCFSRARLAEVRLAFDRMIRQGEQQLHRLSQLLCRTFLQTVQVHSVVIGEVELTGERFTLTQRVSVEDLYASTDLDLGNRQLGKLRFLVDQRWSGAKLVANVVDYQPLEPNAYDIHRITTRIKAEEQLWNKVVDEIFELDRLVQQDKKLRHLSRYVKDVFGLKIVVGEAEQAQRMVEALARQTWSDELLAALDIVPADDTRRLALLEVKNYLAAEQQKRSGWAALKLVARWAGKTCEIQIQPLHNFLHERELLTSESHVSFKERREQVRRQLAEKIPLFGFYQALLRWLFLDPSTPPPRYPGLHLSVAD